METSEGENFPSLLNLTSVQTDYYPENGETTTENGSAIDLFQVQNDSRSQDSEFVCAEAAAVWCEECGVHNIGECFIHGGNMTIAHDNILPSRACLSLPKILSLKRVRDADPCTLEAKRGVFAKKLIKARTLFGPMEAESCISKPKPQTGIMEYEIETSSGTHYLNISDEHLCNWMMFVRPANTFTQQNMAAFQNKNGIYFVTCKNIPSGTELRVWYAAAYAKSIGKRILVPEPRDMKTFRDRKAGKGCNENSKNANNAKMDSPNKLHRLVNETLDHSTSKKNKSNSEPSYNGSHNIPSMLTKLEKPVRSSNSGKEVEVMHTCNTCNTGFERLSQLDHHICKEIGEGEDESGFGTRRRKGKPRKLLDNEENCPKPKILKTGQSENVEYPHLNGANLPHEDIINHGNNMEESSFTGDDGKQDDENRKEITMLPSTALIPTTAEMSDDDSGNLKLRRGRGHPRGSRNQSLTSSNVKRSLRKDATSPNKRPTFTCQYCDKKFTRQEQHLIHEASHFNTLPFVCQFEGCGKSFNSKFKHQRHLTVHEKPNNFECKFCSSTFNRVDHLKNHLLVHDSNRSTFVCDICGKTYLYKATLLYHKAKHSAEEGKSLNCLVCNQACESKEELMKHINTHNRYKPEPERQRKHCCPHCDKKFTTAKDIRRHMVTHTKERPFLCELCPQTFVRKDHLRRHYTSNHKKEFYESQKKSSPYGCSACLMVFKKKEFLDFHMKNAHPNGLEEVEPKAPREKSNKNSVKIGNLNGNKSEMLQQSQAKINKQEAQNEQLVQRLLLQKKQNQSLLLQQQQQITEQQQNVQQPQLKQTTALQQQLIDPYPISVVKIQPSHSSNRPMATVFPATVQSAASQTPLFDSEEVVGEIYTTTPMKTVPFRFDSQSLIQPQPQVQVHSSQQQQQQILTEIPAQQVQLDPQIVVSSLQLQQQQQHQTPMQQQQQQVHLHQQKPHLQAQQQPLTQPATQVFQGMPVAEMLSSLASLTQAQTQDISSSQNANIFNIISVGGQSFIMTNGQALGMNKTIQCSDKVVKDPVAENKQPQLGLPVQHISDKPETSCLVNSQGQVLRASVSKPDHCYATVSMANPTLSRILNNPTPSKTDLQNFQKQPHQDQRTTDNETARMMAQLKNVEILSASGNISININDQNQTEILLPQQLQPQQPERKLQPQHQHLQQHQQQDQLQQQKQLQQQQEQLQQQKQLQHQQEQLQQQKQLQHQQEQLQQQKQLQHQQEQLQHQQQNLQSFTLAWNENLPDYTQATELPASSDASLVVQGDGLGTVVPGSVGGNWFMVQPAVLDQQQTLGPQMITVSAANTNVTT